MANHKEMLEAIYEVLIEKKTKPSPVRQEAKRKWGKIKANFAIKNLKALNK